LYAIPVSVEIHNIEMNAGQGGKLVRTAGGVAKLMAKEGDWATIILPSGETRIIRRECRATVGRLSNSDYQNVSIGKAGRKRHMGFRPHVRGKAQNPVAHPMGGGEGRANGGRHPCSPTAGQRRQNSKSEEGQQFENYPPTKESSRHSVGDIRNGKRKVSAVRLRIMYGTLAEKRALCG
jgi:large subunit ribosomal protein L2